MNGEVLELNDGQQEVADHAGGPLLVVAGAGTGKTRVIVEKINRLLDEGVPPQAILAVTFTEKAAAEMQERVTLSRSGLLLDLQIMTFNGYGDSLLREFSADIGIPRSFRLLGPQAQVVFVRERIDELGLDYFMPITASPDGVIEDILGYFSQLKQHVITPEAFEAYAKSLPEKDEAEKLEKTKQTELAQAYAAYARLCRQENVIDYDDQIYLAVQLLENRPNIRRQLQQRYQIIFVDEFQDTNPMQSRLIDLLYDDNPDKNRSLVVVGDDDQSIYGFRGATLQNLLGFKDRYPKASEVPLTVNYRSHQSILDAAYKLIQHNNPNRLEAVLNIDKRLTSDRPGQAPVLKRFDNLLDELSWIAADIARRLEAGEDPGCIAVLTRSNPMANQVHQALVMHDVPHRVIGANPDLYTRRVVRMLTMLAQTLAEPGNSASLHHTLVSDLFSISNQIVGPLAARARKEHEQLEDLLVDEPEAGQAIALIKTLRAEAASTPVGYLLWQAVKDSGYLDRLKNRAPSDPSAGADMTYLKQYFDSLKEFEDIAVQPTVVQYLESLPALRAAGETADDTMDISSNDVTVTTIHKAKGLEWDTVYVPGLTEGTFPWLRRSSGPRLPDALRAGSDSPADEHYAEERRLMYVAVTRARRDLTLSFSSKGKTGTSRKPSRFIDEMFGAGTAESAPVTEADAGQQTLLELPMETPPQSAVPSSIYDGAKIRLSVSQALALLDCPLNFYYKFVLHTPEDPTPRTGYGSQLHDFFEEINKGRRDGSLRPLEEMLSDLKTGWRKAGYVSKTQRDNALVKAQSTLTEFYNQAVSSPPPLYVEEEFEITLEPENIALRGRFDVVLDNDGVEIRDYKTGNSVRDETAANRRASSSSQLTMYALAWQMIHGEIPARLSLQFVDTGLTGSVRKTQRGIDGLRSRLNQAADCIRSSNFIPGSKHDYCIHPPLEES